MMITAAGSPGGPGDVHYEPAIRMKFRPSNGIRYGVPEAKSFLDFRYLGSIRNDPFLENALCT